MRNKKSQGGNQPETTYRIGSISGSIFANSVESNGSERVFRSVQLQRNYRDGNEWKASTSFTLADLPAAIRVLELSLKYIEGEEAESQLR